MLLYRKREKGLKEEDFSDIAADPGEPLDLSRRFMRPGRSHGPVWRMLDRLYGRFERQIYEVAQGALPLSSLAPELAAIAARFRDTGMEQENLSARMREGAESAAKAGSRMADLSRRAAACSGSIAESLHLCERQGRVAGDGMARIGAETRTLSEKVETLALDAGRIDAIIGKIAGIADDTGLLSLNASIEAARSGAVGAGFGVIAQEIRRLSSEVSAAAEHIRQELSRIREQVGHTSEAVARVKGCVEEGEGAIAGVLSGLGAVGVQHGAFVKDMDIVRETAEAQAQVIGDMRESVLSLGVGIEKRNAENVKILDCAERIRALTETQLVATGAFHLSCHRRAREAVGALAASTEILSDKRAVREGLLRDFVSGAGYVELAYMTDSQGVQTVANQFRPGMEAVYASDGLGSDWSDRPWFGAVRVLGEAFVSEIYRSRATDAFCCTVSVPVRNKEGIFCGVLAADLCLGDLLKAQG
jgi:methyl-accepting chemotaxis protein